MLKVKKKIYLFENDLLEVKCSHRVEGVRCWKLEAESCKLNGLRVGILQVVVVVVAVVDDDALAERGHPLGVECLEL